MLIRKNLEFSPRPSVGPAWNISKSLHYFSETLQLVRTQKGRKNVPSAFLKKNPVSPILANNCPKLAIFGQNTQKWRFFAFFSESLHYFSETLQLIRAFNPRPAVGLFISLRGHGGVILTQHEKHHTNKRKMVQIPLNNAYWLKQSLMVSTNGKKHVFSYLMGLK